MAIEELIDCGRYSAASWRKRRELVRHYESVVGRVYAWRRTAMTEAPADVRAAYRELARLIRVTEPHVDHCTGNGRSCACKMLNLACAALDPTTQNRLLDRAKLLAQFLTVLLGFAIFGMTFKCFFGYGLVDFRAGRQEAAAFSFGIAGGAALTIFNLLCSVTGLGFDRIFYFFSTLGRHPDGAWRLVPRALPSARRRLRVSELQRRLAVARHQLDQSMQAQIDARKRERSRPMNRMRSTESAARLYRAHPPRRGDHCAGRLETRLERSAEFGSRLTSRTLWR